MEKVKIGVVGVGRGFSMMKYCQIGKNAQLVAICDNWEEGLRARQKDLAELGATDIGFYTNFDSFLEHEMDVVILANYATEHVPFAIKAMEKGFHVFSEVLPCQNMKEAVELIETIERTGRKYCYLENACYFPGTTEMKRLYKQGAIGEFEYGEAEYCHNCEADWPKLTHGNPDHWRNKMYSTFYCTHSMGPLTFITGLRPVSVTGFELPNKKRMRDMGRLQGLAGIEMVTMENGAICKSIHGELYCHSLWCSIYGDKGRMESAREDAEMGHNSRVYLNMDKVGSVYGDPDNHIEVNYIPKDKFYKTATKKFSHNGADFYCMWNAVEYILGNPDADIIDVYGAMNMHLPGLFAYFSLLAGGIPMEIPDLRDPAQREKYRNDTRCTDPKVAGDQLIPQYSRPADPIPAEVYEIQQKKWMEIAPK